VEGFRVRVWTRLEEREREEVGSGVPVREEAGRRREASRAERLMGPENHHSLFPCFFY